MPKLYKDPAHTFDYNDIILVPEKCVVTSRSEVDVTTVFGGRTFKSPVVPANMSTIVDQKTCEWLAANGYFYVMHRFDVDAVQFTKDLQSKGLFASVSLGIKAADYETIDRFVSEGISPEYVTVDVAHGDSEEVFKIVRHLKTTLPETFVIAGNVATPAGALRLVEAGASAVKVGVGPGCFVAGTRVLMADGVYKNIEDIQIGNLVINQEGNPVKVIQTQKSGSRLVQKYKHANWYTHSYATADHQHYGIDGSFLSQSVLQSDGLANIGNRKIKGSGNSRINWMTLENPDLIGLTFPKEINFILPQDFTINLKNYGSEQINSKKITNNITSSYGLGYLFGTFLGDGNSVSDKTDKLSGKKTGGGWVQWFFGSGEQKIVNKVVQFAEEIFGVLPKIEVKENMIVVSLYRSSIAALFSTFGKKTEKHLPEIFLINDREYLLGIYEGLIDSDGHLEQSGRETFVNTSKKLIELMSVISSILFKKLPGQIESIPNSTYHKSFKNAKTSYKSRLTRGSKQNVWIKDYFCVRITEKPTDYEIQETYDIEVDCPTHSFIANNAIVHNSACLTTPNTGFGTQQYQLSAVADVAEALKDSKVQIVADGGIRLYGDYAKSVAFGADMVMVGGMLAGHTESPGEIIETEDGAKKEFFGSASEYQKGEVKHVEGKRMLVPYKGPLALTMQTIIEHLQSSVSYAGGRKLLDLRNVSYVRL